MKWFLIRLLKEWISTPLHCESNAETLKESCRNTKTTPKCVGFSHALFRVGSWPHRERMSGMRRALLFPLHGDTRIHARMSRPSQNNRQQSQQGIFLLAWMHDYLTSRVKGILLTTWKNNNFPYKARGKREIDDI